jgi:hypothetical protein
MNMSCPNRITEISPFSSDRWDELLPALTPRAVNDHLHLLQKARLIFLTRYGVLVALFFTTSWWMVARVLEPILGAETHWAPALGLYSAGLIAIFLIVGFFNAAEVEGRRGIWGALKENTDALFRLVGIPKLYDRLVCKYGEQNYSFRPIQGSGVPPVRASTQVSIFALISYLDRIVIRKLDSIAAGRAKRPGEGIHLVSILVALEEFFKEQFNGSVQFHARLYLVEADSLAEVPKTSSREHSSLENIPSTSDRLVAQVVRLKHPLSMTDPIVSNILPGKRSEFYYPILQDANVSKTLARRQLDVPPCLGALRIIASDERVFTEDNEKSNTECIVPFATRLMYEVILRIIANREEQENA